MGDLEDRLAHPDRDPIDDAEAAAALRAGRVPPPGVAEIKWHKGTHLEVNGLPIKEGQSADRALLKFLADVMGDDAGLVDALDLDRLSFSLLYDDESNRRLAWVKCPVDRNRIRPAHVRDAASQLVEELAADQPIAVPEVTTDHPTDDLWFPSDLQLGKKAEMFGGYAATRSRWGWLVDVRLPAITSDVRKIWIPTAGDLTEGCQGSYPNQPYTVTLNTAEQFKAALGMLKRMTKRALHLAPEVEITAVASNHDQNSRGSGRDNVTDHYDDRSFMLMYALESAFAESPHADRVTVSIPADPLVAALQVRSTVVAVTHGHKASPRSSKPPVVKVREWWDGQIKSRHGAAAAAQVLVAAHYHHHYLTADGGKLLVGLPAMDGGSGYLKDDRGVWSLPGFVTMGVDDFGVRSPVLHTWQEDRRRAAEHFGVAVP